MRPSSLLPPPPRPTSASGGVRKWTRSLQTWIWIGGASAVLGVLAVVIWVGIHFARMSAEVDALNRSVPGTSSEFVVDESVDWTVFVEPSDASMSGIRFRIWDVGAGREVAMRPYGRSFSYGLPSHTGRAIATVSLDPGTYSIQIEGSGLGLAVGPSPAGHVVWMLVGGLVIGLPFVLGGIAVAVIAAVRQSRRRNQVASLPPPTAWSTGQWSDSER